MSWLLNIVYLAVIALAWRVLLYAGLFKGKYREGFAENFLGRVPRRSSDRPCIWLHAVSVGEVNLLATLLGEIERRRPDVECVISTTTMTGYALARKKYSPRTVFYCPLDFSWAVKSAMQRIRPDLLLLAELELWPNLIRAAKSHGAKVAVVNGRLSEKSFRGYSRIRPLVRGLLSQVDVIAVQNEEYAERFRSLREKGSGGFLPGGQARASRENVVSGKKTPDPICVTGSLKFDGAETDRNNPQTQKLAALAGIEPGDVVLLAGSTQAPEEELALAAFRELQDAYPSLRLIVVPRHPDRFEEVADLLDQSGLPWQRRSQLTGPVDLPAPAVLLVDTVGELGAWWGTADIAYVGGSMGSRGGQNMIEPAAYGAAVSFGPNTWNFRDIVQMLLAADAAVVVKDGTELTAFVRRCLAEREYAQCLGERSQQLVQSGLGATAATVDLILPLLPAHSPAAEPLRKAG